MPFIKIKIIKTLTYNFKLFFNRFKNFMSLIYQRRSKVDDSNNSYNGATIQSLILSHSCNCFNIKNLKT